MTLPQLGGQGVLVPGELILTAAHCIDFDTKGGMVLSDYYTETLATPAGPLNAYPVMVEAITDIAALGPLDNQAFCDEADRAM